MMDLRHLTVLILGLGDSGLAMARWSARCGAQVRVWDSRPQPPQATALHQALPQVVLCSGPLEGSALGLLTNGVARIFKSPGLAPSDVRLQALFDWAQSHQVPVQGELDLFTQALNALRSSHGYAPKLVAITGTNGKTTTTAMTCLLMGRTGLRVGLAGNIGPTLLQTLSDALDQEALPEPEAPATVLGHETLESPAVPLVQEAPQEQNAQEGEEGEEALQEDSANLACNDETLAALGEAGLADDNGPLIPWPVPSPAAPVFVHLPEVWVLELSSFQLHGVQGFEPSAAAVLNISEDHLDWHGSLAAYAADKALIFGQTATMVINQDDPMVRAMAFPAPDLNPEPKPKGRGRVKPVKVASRHVVQFGLHPPQRPGDFGLCTDNRITWLVRALETDDTIKLKRGEVVEQEIHIQRLMPIDALRVRGRHNAANALAALALATAIGCPLAPMLHGLREYRGEPHRVAYVATLNGVDLVDDSKGTNVGATVAALLGLGADCTPAKLVVILGGDGKGQNFEPLLAPLQRHARAVATLGRDAAQIETALAGLNAPVRRCQTLPEATRWALEQAQRGDTVLLSPACASLDMFDHYKHRAQVFVDEIQALAKEQGEVPA